MTEKPLKGLKVAYLYVHDVNYPRNRLIREYLEESGAEVDVFTEHAIGRRNPFSPSSIAELSSVLKGYDAAILSEFQLRYALSTGIAAKLSGTKLIVDGFVGRYETAIGDWGQASRFSLKSLVYHLVDASSLIVADLFIIDNDFRAEQIRSRYAARFLRKEIIAVPVGAPKWASPLTERNTSLQSNSLRVLYYGNYVPLHGVEVVLAATSKFVKDRPMSLTLVGNGTERAKFERKAESLGISNVCEFRDAVEEDALRPLIASSDVVMGVFGDSPKAKAVIANKVWQGLAMGKRVITRKSQALDELSFVDQRQLLQVAPTTTDILLALINVSDLKQTSALSDFELTGLQLQSYVDRRFTEFLHIVEKEVMA